MFQYVTKATMRMLKNEKFELKKISRQRDSLVGFYFEVSAFLKLTPIFVPAEGRAGVPQGLALQVQLVPFHQ